MTELPTRACWHEEEVSAIIGNEALEGHEGVFLATHTPVVELAVRGSHAAEIKSHDERGVLDALSTPVRGHAFCVVQGEPGSGKSHLIRWLSVSWPKDTSDVKLLLQRADGSLEGALRQLQERLPEEFKELFEQMGRRHRATLKGRANLFLSHLATSLDPDHFDPPLEDADWCRANTPSELVGHPIIKKAWNSPGRIMRLMEGKGEGDEGTRNSATASFNLFDIAELAESCSQITGIGVPPTTKRLAKNLLDESYKIDDLRRTEWTAEEIERDDVRDELKTSLQLMEALNRRRNDAIQNLLGVSAEGLKKLFRQIREELNKRDQRLILLLEDITSWEGVDDSLIDVLVTNAGTRLEETGERDMCPLISVVGVTPAYYQKLHGNYRGRITHDLSLGETRDGSDLQDVAALRDRHTRLAFSARYLAAVRAGSDRLQQWREAQHEGRDVVAPNSCEGCPTQEECHRVFGADNGVGFFPFTAGALERMFDALNEHDNGMTWKTPRGILQAILSPTLSRPDAIESSTYPTVLLDSGALAPESRLLSPRLKQLIELQVEEHDRPRMQRVLAYWGDRERADTAASGNGDVAFAGVPRGVFEAFGLPWIGEAEVTLAEPDPAPQSKAMSPEMTETDWPPSDPRPKDDVETEKPIQRPVKLGPAAPERSRSARVPPSMRRTPTKSELERMREQLRHWAETGDLRSPSDWNKELYRIVSAIRPRRIGIDAFTFRRIITPELVKIEGTGPVRRNYLNVKREPWVVGGFEGYVALSLDKTMTKQDNEYHRGNLAIMMRRLESLVAEYADRRLGDDQNGQRWSPVAGVIQVLLARAWLRGVVNTDAAPQEQLKAILSDEPDVESDPTARCQPWQEYLNNTKGYHTRFRDALREMIGTPQGEAKGFGLADVSSACGAISRLSNRLKFDSPPLDAGETGVNEIDALRKIISDNEDALRKILRSESKLVRDRAKLLEGNLRGRSIGAHLKRVDGAIDTVADLLPMAVPDRVQEWKTGCERLRLRLDAGADGAVQNLLFSTISEDGDGSADKNAPLLGRLAEAPVKDLNDFRELTRLGERVVGELLNHVRDCVREGRGSISLEDVRDVGRAIRSVLDAVPEAAGSNAA